MYSEANHAVYYSYEVQARAEGTIINYPVSQEEARRILWDVNSSQIVHELFVTQGARLQTVSPENPEADPRWRAGAIVDAAGEAIGSFVLRVHKPTLGARILAWALGEEPHASFSGHPTWRETIDTQ